MADSTGIILANYTPLVSNDSAGVDAVMVPRVAWQPCGLLQTPFTTALSLGVGVANDIQRVLIGPRRATPGVVYQLYSLRAVIKCQPTTANFSTLFKATGIFTAQRPISDDGLTSYDFAWDSVTVGAVVQCYNGGAQYEIRPVDPVITGYPPPFQTANAASVEANCLAGFMFIINTWDAAAAANTRIHVDARWMAFPTTAQFSAGLYSPRMFANPGAS